MTQTIVGIFDDPKTAQNAVDRLTSEGFSQTDIDIDQSGMSSDSTEKSEASNEDFGDRVGRFFRNLFDNERDAERYSTVARKGTVVSVYADSSDKAQRAAYILDNAGAVDVDERFRGERTTAGTTVQQEDEMASRQDYPDEARDISNRSIPVIEEDLQVGKREVETGGMRIRSRIIDKPVEESLRLRQERVSVERTPVNRPATEADLNTFREGEIEVRERAEIPVVNKEARVVEEINVRKDVEEREEIVRDTVRKTDVEIDETKDTDDAVPNQSRTKRKS